VAASLPGALRHIESWMDERRADVD
jgi:hypothetical protein